MKMITGVTMAAALMLTGCSGSDDGAEVDSGQAVADMVGCEGFEATSEEMYVTEGGPCQLDGEEISVYYFADEDARDSYVEIASDFGGNYLVGDSWVVDAPPAVLDELEEQHGGERSAE